MRLGPITILFSVLFTGFNANAHHASAGIYDRNNIGEIKGEISTVFWRNPHVRLGVIHIGENGEPQEWEVEFGSVNTVERLGVMRDDIKVGDQVTISGSVGRNGRHVMFTDTLTLSTGEELVLQAADAQKYGITPSALRDARTADAELRADIFRVWLPSERPRTGDGITTYPLTQVGFAAQSQWDSADDPALRCIPPGVPTAMDNPYPIEFIDHGDSIEMLLEEWDGVRTINMSGADSGEPVQPRMGHSTGSWEGDTLIINTSNIGWRYVDDLGTPQSEDAVIVERFTLNSDGTQLDWHAEITDPINFTEPVVMTGTWIWIPGHEIKPYNCELPGDS